jgi:hypothetical protein
VRRLDISLVPSELKFTYEEHAGSTGAAVRHHACDLARKRSPAQCRHLWRIFPAEMTIRMVKNIRSSMKVDRKIPIAIAWGLRLREYLPVNRVS